MKTSLWHRLSPHVIAIAIFFVVSCFYCLPAFKGMVVEQHDVQSWKGMAQQSFEFKEKYGHYPLWGNSMFSGMPAFQILGESNYVTIAIFHYAFTLFLPSPASLFFLSCVCFYILCMVLRLRNLTGIFGSLAYAFCSYNAILVAVGHTTKFASMGYAPAVLAGLILLTQKKYVLGFISTLLFSTLLFYQNHLQIVYYTLLMAVCLGIGYLIYGFRQKQLAHVGISAALALVAAGLAVASYAVSLMSTYDYSKETMRGGRSELTLGETQNNKTTGGLDKDYAFMWSYGIAETFTLVVPRIFGGATPSVVNNQYVNEIGQGSKTAGVLSETTGMNEDQADDFVKQFSPYWGPQPSPTAPVYLGAVVCVVFIFGLIFYKGWHKGWLVAATILGIAMAWGKNFSSLNYFLFDYLPLYNKFRAPSMALVIPQLTIALIASLGLQQLLYDRETREELGKKIKQAFAVVAGLVGVLVIMYFMFDYKTGTDNAVRENLTNSMLQQMSQGQQPTPQIEQQAADFGRSIVNALRDDRRSLFGGDLLRSILFMAIASGFLWLYFKNKLSGKIVGIGLTALSMIDLLGIDTRYLNTNNYVENEEFLAAFTPTAADLQIKRDTGYFRVYDMTDPNNVFQSSRASYHHNTIGGYHPAKLGLYNDLIQHQLGKGNMEVFNMLNAKYFIVIDPGTNQPVVQQNPDAMGPVWFVNKIKYVNTANEEMQALDSFNPKDVAIINKKEQSKIPFPPQPDSGATITLVENLNDKILYTSESSSNQFAVFSEVYYPGGWKAFIDGKETPIVKVNYALRGMAVPAGKHIIEFRFEPEAYLTGMRISKAVGVVSFLLLAAGIFWLWKKDRNRFIRKPTV